MESLIGGSIIFLFFSINILHHFVFSTFIYPPPPLNSTLSQDKPKENFSIRPSPSIPQYMYNTYVYRVETCKLQLS